MVVVINRMRKLNISAQKIINSVHFNVSCSSKSYNMIIKVGDEIIKPNRNIMDTTIKGRDFMSWSVNYNGLEFNFNHYGDYFKIFVYIGGNKYFECKNFSVEWK